MIKYKQYIDILADSLKETIQQMTEIVVEDIQIEEVEGKIETYPIAHEMAYFDDEEKIDGDFVLAFENESTALKLASGIGKQMGLSPLERFDDDATDLLNEFINVVVGRAISEWDQVGLSVRFNPPEFKMNIEMTNISVSQVYKITARTNPDLVMLDQSPQDLALYITFTEKTENILKKMRVIVVEDSRVIRGIISRALKNEGCEIQEAKDGKEALSVHKSFRPDLTLMDINMPKMSGFDSITQIRKSDPQAKFIILSSSSKRDEVLTAKSLGVLGYLVKPIKPEVLVKRIKELLKNN
jgi:CheY-like chemotaxis protein